MDQPSSCTALCLKYWLLWHLFHCTANAKYWWHLPSFCWFSLFMDLTRLGKKVSAQMRGASWIAARQPHIPDEKEQEVSLFPRLHGASQPHLYKGCRILAGALISNVFQRSFVLRQLNAQNQSEVPLTQAVFYLCQNSFVLLGADLGMQVKKVKSAHMD